MPARVAPVSLWTDTGAVRCVTKAFSAFPMICEILVALQGRVDAARLFGQRLEQILFKLGARRSTWDPKAYFFHFGPLTDTLTVSSRQHLATPDMHANEVLAAGTIMHKIANCIRL